MKNFIQSFLLMTQKVLKMLLEFRKDSMFVLPSADDVTLMIF